MAIPAPIIFLRFLFLSKSTKNYPTMYGGGYKIE